jgi:hypothetical protein
MGREPGRDYRVRFANGKRPVMLLYPVNPGARHESSKLDESSKLASRCSTAHGYSALACPFALARAARSGASRQVLACPRVDGLAV